MDDHNGEIIFDGEENDRQSYDMLVPEANNFEETQSSYIHADFQRDVLLMSADFENACLEPFDVDADNEDNIQNQCEDVNMTKYFTTEKVFEDCNDLTNWAKDVGKEHGVVIVTGKSQNAKAGKAARLWLTCERSGKHRVHKKNTEKNKPKRNTGTKKTNWPFKLRGRSVPNSSNWTVTVENGYHNHRLAKALEGHSYAGRLTREELDLVKMMTKSGAKPKQLMIMLKQRDPSNLSITRHVYNARHKFRMTNMDGRTQMQEILGLLRENKYLEWSRHSINGDVLGELFWAHPESVKLAQCFPCDIYIKDIYCLSSFNGEERALDFTWALERFRDLLGELPSVIVTDRDLALMNVVAKVFPDSSNHLCRWHISMGVLGAGRKTFPKDDDKVALLTNMWRDVVNSDTENDFALNFTYIERDFTEYPKLIKYPFFRGNFYLTIIHEEVDCIKEFATYKTL